MKRTPETSPNIFAPKFEKGDTITCPSDGTGIKWTVVGKKPKGVLLAVVAYGENYPSQQYPRTIEISLEAQNDWKKV